MLGAGGMGAVCLAQQISLDRQVALKILPTHMAKNPDFLMRFTREALSAAQMTHHNIIQIHDIGSDRDIHYISMEYVRGENLTDVVRKQGKLAPEVAAGYALQAARGLQYAHERGIIHRDIKPDNLMLNEHGIVKIADMGLAKMRGEEKKDNTSAAGAEQRATMLQKARGDLTMGDVAMGTPAYMPPEQARDAGGVDHRADQYSLGCTLYYLCAGRTPFSGNSAYELINKHIMEPLPPIEGVAPQTPRALGVIIERMMEKIPEDRYPSMNEVIHDLEGLLGVVNAKGESQGLRDTHVKLLDEAQREFYSVPALAWRRMALIGYFALCAALMALFAMLNDADWLVKTFGKDAGIDFAKTILGMALLTPLAHFILDGLLNRTVLFRRVKNTFSGISIKGWLILAAAMGLTIMVFGSQLVLGFVGAGLAAGCWLSFVKRPLWNQRRVPLERIRLMLKEVRVSGLSEEALQEFVARYTGDDWEEFFEGLFGYNSLIAARAKWGVNESGKTRKQYATWREPLTRWLDNAEQMRKRLGEKKRLSEIEAQRLKAQGVTENEARAQADIEASRIVKGGYAPRDTTPAIPIAAPKLKNREPEPARPAIKVIRSRGHRFFSGDQLLRLFIGLGLCALYGLNDFMGFDPVPQGFKLQHYNDILALIAGIAAAASAFSTRTSLGVLTIVGAALMIGMEPISAAVGNPAFSAQFCMGVGVIFIMLGFGLPLLYRLMGERY